MEEHHPASKIFVCDMGDLFGICVPDDAIEMILSLCLQCPNDIFQFLTKRPERLADFNPWPDNCWVGATATDQKMFDKAIRALYDVDARIRFLSCEPLLGRITFGAFLPNPFDWIIVGALTRSSGGPCSYKITESTEILLDRARNAAIPIFVKNNVPWTGKRPQEWPKRR